MHAHVHMRVPFLPLSLFSFSPLSLSLSLSHTHAHTGANGVQSTPLYPSRTGCAPNRDISSYFSDGYRVAYGQWYFASSPSSSLARSCTLALSHSCSILLLLPMALSPSPHLLASLFLPFPSFAFLLCAVFRQQHDPIRFTYLCYAFSMYD